MPSQTFPVVPLRFRRAPLLAAGLWFAAGVLWGHLQVQQQHLYQPTAVLLGSAGLLALLAGVALHRRLRVAILPVAALWAVLGLAAQQWQPSPPYPIALMRYADNLSRTVEATVVRVRIAPPGGPVTDADSVPLWEQTEEVQSTSAAEQPVILDLAVDRIEDVTPDLARMVPAAGGVRVRLYGAAGLYGPAGLPVACGDRVAVPLRLRPPERFRDPGAFQYADFLLGEGIAAEANAAARQVQRLGAGGATTACRLATAQGWASGRMEAFAGSAANRRLPPFLRLDEPDARMLNAMLFGDRSGLSHGLRVGFERTGSFHLFVVSGLHIGLLAAGVFVLLSRLRTSPWLAAFLTIVTAAAYTALTGAGQPAQRALVMASVFLVARTLSRRGDSLNALGAAVLALLAWAPGSLFEASFQMTALAIVAIPGLALPLGAYTVLRYRSVARDVFRHPRAYFAPAEQQLRVMLELWGEIAADLLGRWALRLPARLFAATLRASELALIGLVAELVMVLPMAMYFHRAAVFALPANLLVIPLIGVLAPAAVLTFLTSLLSPSVAMVPAAATAALLHTVRWAIGGVSHLQNADVRVPPPVWWVGAIAVAGSLLGCWMVRRGRWGAVTVALLLPALAGAVLWPELPLVTPHTLEITAIDVGQGDSLLAVNPDGRSMLIDAGGPVGRGGRTEVVANFDVGEEVVSPYLWSRRFRRLDVVVLSHAHTDHMGGMAAVLENFKPRELWVGTDPASELYRKLLAEAARLGITVRHFHAGDQVRWGAVEISVLAPAPDYKNGFAPRNDDSLVLRMQYGKASALLEGDAEMPTEAAMVAAGRVVPVTLLKVGHHGSRTSSTQPFLDAARPQDAVVSVGRRNTFGHPRGEIIQRLAGEGTHVFRTDEFGLCTFLLSSEGGIREVVDGMELAAHSP